MRESYIINLSHKRVYIRNGLSKDIVSPNLTLARVKWLPTSAHIRLTPYFRGSRRACGGFISRAWGQAKLQYRMQEREQKKYFDERDYRVTCQAVTVTYTIEEVLKWTRPRRYTLFPLGSAIAHNFGRTRSPTSLWLRHPFLWAHEYVTFWRRHEADKTTSTCSSYNRLDNWTRWALQFRLRFGGANFCTSPSIDSQYMSEPKVTLWCNLQGHSNAFPIQVETTALVYAVKEQIRQIYDTLFQTTATPDIEVYKIQAGFDRRTPKRPLENEETIASLWPNGTFSEQNRHFYVLNPIGKLTSLASTHQNKSLKLQSQSTLSGVVFPSGFSRVHSLFTDQKSPWIQMFLSTVTTIFSLILLILHLTPQSKPVKQSEDNLQGANENTGGYLYPCIATGAVSVALYYRILTHPQYIEFRRRWCYCCRR